MSSPSTPGPDLLAGAPQAIFVGRSLLTGRAVCLLFLDGGRVTRSIPTGGLKDLDWPRHARDHAGDSGTWEMDGEQLTIAWGDGGTHRGPLVIDASGIDFYGKRYARPATVDPADLVGRWGSASGTAVSGGEGIVALADLVIDEAGRYAWAGTVGGVVAERAVAGGHANQGEVSIVGQTMTLTSDDGSVLAQTFLPFGGEPLEAFSLDADMFTRVD